MTFDELKLDVVILACAVSAGVHAAFVSGFAIPAVLLAALAVALTRRPTQRTLYVAMALLTALLVAYALVLALHPLDGLTTLTTAIEATALAAAASLVHPNSKGTIR